MSLRKIGTIKSSTTPRVLPAIEGRPRMEVTAVGTSGDILGTDVFGSFATYQAEMKADGHWQGECPDSGFIGVADGVATFSATGVRECMERCLLFSNFCSITIRTKWYVCCFLLECRP